MKDDEALPKVSIIVASYNNEQTIEECLKSILALDYPKGFVEVIVMDGASLDATVQKAKQFPVKIISMRMNCPAAYNYAMKNLTSHDILGFIDSDAKVEPQWLRKLVTRLNEPRVAGVSGSIETWNQENPWAKNIGYEIKNRYRRIGEYTGRIATMNLLMKKFVIEEAGGWNEAFPSQYDTDMGFQLSAKGYRIAYEPTALCYHFNRPTLKAFYRQQRQYGKNTLRLYFKHKGLAKGDEITDFAMNIQPVLILAIVVSFLVGIVPTLRPIWYVSAIILSFMLIYFVYFASKIKIKYADTSTWRLVVLFFVRSFAWFVGAIATTTSYLTGRLK